MFLTQEEFSSTILLNMVVLDMGMRNFRIQRQCVETLGRGVAHDKAAFLVFLLQYRLSPLPGHVTYVPSGEGKRYGPVKTSSSSTQQVVLHSTFLAASFSNVHNDTGISKIG